MAERLDALTVREYNGKSYWTKIGAAFPNKNGEGYIVRLDAVPASVDGQYAIHLRVPLPKDGQGSGQSGGRSAPPERSGFASDDLSDDVPF
jgi:hypothetical protein